MVESSGVCVLYLLPETLTEDAYLLRSTYETPGSSSTQAVKIQRPATADVKSVKGSFEALETSTMGKYSMNELSEGLLLLRIILS